MKPDDPTPQDEEPTSDENAEESPALRALLKRSLDDGAPDPDAAQSKALLEGVQRKLRERSRGKFYADGWSTSQTRTSYVLIATAMLVVIAVVYLALGPTGIQ